LIAEPIERTPLFRDLLISVRIVTRLINGEIRNLPAAIETKPINHSALHRYCLKWSSNVDQVVRSRDDRACHRHHGLRCIDQTCACHFEERVARMNRDSRPSDRNVVGCVWKLHSGDATGAFDRGRRFASRRLSPIVLLGAPLAGSKSLAASLESEFANTPYLGMPMNLLGGETACLEI
jgi:hypothetical protein